MNLKERMAEIEIRLDALRGMRRVIYDFYHSADENYLLLDEDVRNLNQPSFGVSDDENDELRKRELEKSLADTWSKRGAYAECILVIDRKLQELNGERKNIDLGLAFGEFRPNLPQAEV